MNIRIEEKPAEHNWEAGWIISFPCLMCDDWKCCGAVDGWWGESEGDLKKVIRQACNIQFEGICDCEQVTPRYCLADVDVRRLLSKFLSWLGNV